MKKAVSIFMLIVMMLTSVQATWVWHFCGNKLHSVSIAGNHTSCCGGEMADTGENESGAQSIRQPFRSCCFNHAVKVSTDDFSVQQQNLISEISSQIFYPVLFLCNVEIRPGNCSIIQHIFPPGGLAKYTTDILTSICILRI